MAIAFVQACADTGFNGWNTNTCTFGSTTAAGDLLVVHLTTGGGGLGLTTAVTDNTSGGNTWTKAATVTIVGTNDVMDVWYAYNCVAKTGLVVTGTQTGGGANVKVGLEGIEYSGALSASNPLDQTNTNTALFTSPLSVSVTTTAANELLAAGYGDSGGGSTAGTGYTNRAHSVVLNTFTLYEDKLAGAAGSYSATGTSSSALRGAIVLASFKPAAGTAVSDLVPMIGGGRNPRNATYLKMRERELRDGFWAREYLRHRDAHHIREAA